MSESKPQTLLSARGSLNLTQVLGRIPPQLLNPTERSDEIDLSMAENRLIREEILQLARSAIENSLRSKVCHPQRRRTPQLTLAAFGLA
jgi:hypothetical protein